MSKVLTDKKLICDHCGEKCDSDLVTLGDKYFCCNGCKLVYELLSENNLDSYYNIENKPGIKVPESVRSKHFSYLDNEKIIEKIIDFRNESVTKVTLFIPQIHCSSCIWLLENLSRLNNGIKFSRVQYLKKEVAISFVHSLISLRQLVELLATIGYEPMLSLDDYEFKPQKKKTNSLIVRLAIAGFCFANIMLFSFPEYLSTDGLIEPEFQKFFGYLNIL
ncbi:MAG: heavy metal translocating P-type ATPase, partial [Calditrichaeota bacterium]